MNVEIINVGTELLLGEIVNTNATYLQKMCKDLGFNVYHQSVVGDNPERLLECFKIAFQRGADCLITTGGLGPTNDDLTKELSAQFLGLEMFLNEEEEKKVYDKVAFLVGKDRVASANFKQAYFPKDCYILENEVGTANGCVMCKDEKMIVNLPGPPKEMKYVVDHELKPFLQQFCKSRIYTFEYLTMFIGESNLQDLLKNILDKQGDVSIALYAGEEMVRVRLAVIAMSEEEAANKMSDTKAEIEALISPYIIKDKNIKDALMKIMVPYQIKYDGCFKLRDDFLDGQFLSDDPEFILNIKTVNHKLGEILYVSINDNVLKIPVLKKAEYSYMKVQARIIAFMLKCLMKK